MFRTAESGLPKRAIVGYVLVATLGLQAVVIVLIIESERAARRADDARMTFNLNPAVWWRDNVAKPTIRPPISTVAEAKAEPQDLVIGVELNGRARAYRLAAFDDPSGHVVNDLIGDVPVSVAYSTLNQCVRVYTGPKNSGLLDAEVPGLLNQRMVIKLGGTLYFHRSGMPVEPAGNPPPIPYTLINPTVTTWKEWTRRHPDTDIFVGGR
jgi:hypothetical protein